MKKIVPYGVLLLGILFCLYSPLCKWAGRQKQQKIEKQEETLGSLEIPSIQVNLPIFSGAEEETLAKGVGYLVESSPLGGGENTHCLLAGHRGLPSADMFLRLDELQEGDRFVIRVAEQELVYEVCKIQVIRPTETESLRVQEGKELVSLVTCTPYGINTHRLVVTGERKVYDEQLY